MPILSRPANDPYKSSCKFDRNIDFDCTPSRRNFNTKTALEENRTELHSQSIKYQCRKHIINKRGNRTSKENL